MIARQLARYAVGALCLLQTACTPPAPTIDEERLARRVAEILAEQYSSQAFCGTRRSGASSDGGVEDPEELTEDGQNQDDSPAQPTMAQLQQAMIDQAALETPELVPAFGLASVTLPADMAPTITGDAQHQRVCFPDAGSPSVGPTEAKVTVIAFVDMECPFTARLYPSIVRLRQQWPNDLRIVWKSFALSHHTRAPRAAEALRFLYDRSGADVMTQVMGRMYQNVRAMSLADLEREFANEGVTPITLRDSLRARRFSIPVAQEVRQGEAAHITGTPTLFVNGRAVVGTVPVGVLFGVVQEELSRATALMARNPRPARDVLCRADRTLTPSTPARMWVDAIEVHSQ